MCVVVTSFPRRWSYIACNELAHSAPTGHGFTWNILHDILCKDEGAVGSLTQIFDSVCKDIYTWFNSTIGQFSARWESNKAGGQNKPLESAATKNLARLRFIVTYIIIWCVSTTTTVWKALPSGEGKRLHDVAMGVHPDTWNIDWRPFLL